MLAVNSFDCCVLLFCMLLPMLMVERLRLRFERRVWSGTVSAREPVAFAGLLLVFLY